MKIFSLVDNLSNGTLSAEHGLSLYIQLDDGMTLLFDMGQGNLFAENANRLGLSISNVDVAVISHGHYDHGGGLETFLKLNTKAKVYIHPNAFDNHYSLKPEGLKYIGLDASVLSSNLGLERLVFVDGLYEITENIRLFSNVKKDKCFPNANKLLYGPDKSINDDFVHEQNLLIREHNKWTLFAGCAHCGILNIMEKAIQLTSTNISSVFGGMHLKNSDFNEHDENLFIETLCKKLQLFKNCKYYTMHCTGFEAYTKMKKILNDRIEYFNGIIDL